MPVNIEPFGTSTDSATHDLAQIKLFGCTVVDFNVSADWSSQGGSLSCRLIESDTDGDRLTIPVLGSPVLFELKNSAGNVLFQYIGLVDSFSRSSSNSKTYSATLSSPMTILDSTTVILAGYAGLGSSQEGSAFFAGMENQDFGHNNSNITVGNTPGVYNWWNVANLINVFGILENDDLAYRVPTDINASFGVGGSYGDFGFSGKSKDGITLIKLMWALHVGINHLPPISEGQAQKTHGGNLLFGRHNYNLYDDREAIPYYYHFDAIHFYNQVVHKIGSQYRISGEYKSLSEIISHICNEANLEFFTYIDIYTDPTIGDPTLQDQDQYMNKPAIFNWQAGAGQSMTPVKFPLGGNYGGTIRVQIIDKNAFFNRYRPFSNIAYNLIGLESPDLKDAILSSTSSNGIHPGKRPINDFSHGIVTNGTTIYSDPLDSYGVNQWRGASIESTNSSWGFTDVGTKSIANGGSFPVEGVGANSIFDPNKLGDIKIKNSDISIKLNDFTTMKVITGGYQTRLVSAPRQLLRHYWGDIIINEVADPKDSMDTITDSLGLNETSTRKIPVLTPLLDPRDVDDYILIDMKSEFGPISVYGVLHKGIYAASLLEVRCAMTSFESWKAFIEGYKNDKIRNLVNAFYPGLNKVQQNKINSTNYINSSGGLGYSAVASFLGLGNIFTFQGGTSTQTVGASLNQSGQPLNSPSASGAGIFGLGFDVSLAAAIHNIKKNLLPRIHEKVKDIGDTHYGKSWYAPIPYLKAVEDLDGDNLVGNFKRSWELTDSAYVEPSNYYSREIPQSNMFIKEGKVSSFLNYDHNFLSSSTGAYDTTYAQDITNLVGQTQKICNFSEYSFDKLCMTKFSPLSVDANGVPFYNTSDPGITIVHAAPESIENTYSFLPIGYDSYYNRPSIPYSDIITGLSKRYEQTNTSQRNLIPSGQGQSGTSKHVKASGKLSISKLTSPTGFKKADYGYGGIIGIPSQTQHDWLTQAVNGLQSLNYPDNGRFSFPFVKFQTCRVFLPVPKPGFIAGNGMGDIPVNGLNAFLGTSIKNKNGQPNQPGDLLLSNRGRQTSILEDQIVSVLQPFQACVVPRSFNYSQISTRYVYGPWMTSLEYIPFRGKIEYEQDESLIPQNFLIPINFGEFGNFTLSQTSGFAGMNLAAQGRANSIDDFALFAVEEGSITVPGAPSIRRIGDSLYGIQQVTDIKISVSDGGIETTYSFKTLSPKFGKNTRDLEQKLTKISNDIKKLKLR